MASLARPSPCQNDTRLVVVVVVVMVARCSATLFFFPLRMLLPETS